MASVLIVEARYYAHLNDLLLAGARGALDAAGHSHETVTVPGALEVPGAVALAAEGGHYDAFVALGVVIRGETYHFEIVAGESARALMALTLDGLAIGNGILTVETEAPGAGAGPTPRAATRAAERRRRRWRCWRCDGGSRERAGAGDGAADPASSGGRGLRRLRGVCARGGDQPASGWRQIALRGRGGSSRAWWERGRWTALPCSR